MLAPLKWLIICVILPNVIVSGTRGGVTCEEVSHSKGGDIGIETAVDRSSQGKVCCFPRRRAIFIFMYHFLISKVFPIPSSFSLSMMPLIRHYNYAQQLCKRSWCNMLMSLSIPYQRHAVSATDRTFSAASVSLLIEGTSDSVLVGLSTVPLSTLLCGRHCWVNSKFGHICERYNLQPSKICLTSIWPLQVTLGQSKCRQIKDHIYDFLSIINNKFSRICKGFQVPSRHFWKRTENKWAYMLALVKCTESRVKFVLKCANMHFFTVRDSLKANTNVCKFFYNAFRHDVQLNCGIDFSLGKVKGDGKIGQPGKCTLLCFSVYLSYT